MVRDLDRGWAGSAFTLTLTGHGAGVWQVGPGGPGRRTHCRRGQPCRMLSGRPAGQPFMGPGDAGIAGQLMTTRVVF